MVSSCSGVNIVDFENNFIAAGFDDVAAAAVVVAEAVDVLLPVVGCTCG
jgi:hypothetical protein